MSDPQPAQKQLARLKEIIHDLGSVLVCYSGGIDSALLLAVSHQVLGPERAIGMTAVSPSLPQSEHAAARDFALNLGATHRLISSHEIQRSGYVKNSPDRCFHCKTELYEIAKNKATEWGLSFIANGTNLDDLGDYRPGLKAAELAQVRSPLCEAQLTKSDVREIAKLLNLPIWDKPASACLASRIPYGVSVTPARLHQIEIMEATLHALGFPQVRVRHHGDVARIEVPKIDLVRLVAPEIAAEVERAGREAGFRYTTLDLQGYRPGSLNEAISRSLPVIV